MSLKHDVTIEPTIERTD